MKLDKCLQCRHFAVSRIKDGLIYCKYNNFTSDYTEVKILVGGIVDCPMQRDKFLKEKERV